MEYYHFSYIDNYYNLYSGIELDAKGMFIPNTEEMPGRLF
jgi:hypothetical protein